MKHTILKNVTGNILHSISANRSLSPKSRSWYVTPPVLEKLHTMKDTMFLRTCFHAGACDPVLLLPTTGTQHVTVVTRPLVSHACQGSRTLITLLFVRELHWGEGDRVSGCPPLAASLIVDAARNTRWPGRILPPAPRWSLPARTHDDKHREHRRRGRRRAALHPPGSPDEHAPAGQGDADGRQPQSDGERGARHRGPHPEDHRLLRLQPGLLQSQKWVGENGKRVMGSSVDVPVSVSRCED